MKKVQPHIRLTEGSGAEYALLPGDPKRVGKVMEFLESPKELEFNREYRSAVGFYRGIKVLALSTGIGGPSLGIAVEELHNIGVHTMIRIGSCGALQNQLQLGDLVIATGAVRNDGTSSTYVEKGFPAVTDPELLISLYQSVNQLDYPHAFGIVRSHDSFYTGDEASINTYWAKKHVLASDMETAPLLVLAALKRMKAASILNVVVPSSGELKEGINDYVTGETLTKKGEERQITLALEAITKFHQYELRK